MKKVSKHSNNGFRIAAIILSVVLAAVSLFAIYEILSLNIFDSSINLILCAIIAVLCILLITMMFALTRSKAGKIVVTTLMVLIIAAMGAGGFYVFKATSLLSSITGDTQVTKSEIQVIVLKDSAIQNESELSGHTVGVLKTVGRANSDQLIQSLTEKNIQVSVTEFDGLTDLAGALYDHSVDSIILPDSSREQLMDQDQEKYKNFNEDTRVVYSISIEKTVTATTKAVEDITNTPFNVLITGVDSRNGFAEVSRSDVNMIATVNPKTHEVLLTSIPRDYYVKTECDAQYGCQIGALDKLTHTGIHGTETTKATLESLLGIEINYTMKVNFSSVINLVNALGGIDVNVAPGLAVGSFWTAPEYGVSEGINHLNGEQALAYARERYAYTDGDRQRVRNQQEVLMAVAKKAMSPAIITGYPALMDALSGALITDMSENEIKSFIQFQMADNPSWTFITYALDGTGSTQFCAELGQNAYVMIPNYETVATAKDRIQAVMDGKSAQEVEAIQGSADQVSSSVKIDAASLPQDAQTPAQQSNDNAAVEVPSEQPVLTDPGYQDPVYQEPVYQEPVYEEPVYQEPVYQEPVYTDPGTGSDYAGY